MKYTFKKDPFIELDLRIRNALEFNNSESELNRLNSIEAILSFNNDDFFNNLNTFSKTPFDYYLTFNFLRKNLQKKENYLDIFITQEILENLSGWIESLRPLYYQKKDFYFLND